MVGFDSLEHMEHEGNAALNNLNILISLAAIAVNLGLAVFVLIQGSRHQINRRFFFFSLSLAFVNFIGLLAQTVSDPATALLWTKALSPGIVFIPSIFYHFVLALVNGSENNLNKRIGIWVNYLISSVLAGLILNGDIVTGVQYIYSGYYPLVNTWAAWLITAFFAAATSDGTWLLLMKYRRSNIQIERQRLLLLITGVFAAGVLTVPNFMLAHGSYLIYPSAQIGTIFLSGIMGYTILKYRLMDITVVVRKSLIYTMVTGIITSVFMINIVLFGKFFETLTGLTSILPSILAASIVAFLFQPIRDKVQNFIDKSFFREHYQLQAAIRDFSRNIVSILDRQELIKVINNTIIHTMHVGHVWIYFYNKTEREYQYLSRESDSEVKPAAQWQRISHNHSLIRWLETEKKELLHSQLEKIIPQKYTPWNYDEIRNLMQQLEAEVCLPLFIENQLTGFITLSRGMSGDSFSKEDIDLLSIMTSESAIALENASLYKEIKDNLLNTIKALSAAVEAKDVYTSGHCERVIGYAVQMGRLLNLPQNQIESIVFGATLHDIGKIGIDEKILQKPGKLTEREFNAIKTHPLTGAKILKAVNLPKEALEIVKYHHERYDGKGYPNGLKNGEIPLAARIISVADAFEALTSDRTYRKALSKEEAINVLLAESGKQFDPEMVSVFTSMVR